MKILLLILFLSISIHAQNEVSKREKKIKLHWTPSEAARYSIPKELHLNNYSLILSELTDTRDSIQLVGKNREFRFGKNLSVFTDDSLVNWCSLYFKSTLDSLGFSDSSKPKIFLHGKINNFLISETDLYEGFAELEFFATNENRDTIWSGKTNGKAYNWGTSLKEKNYQEVISNLLFNSIYLLIKKLELNFVLEEMGRKKDNYDFISLKNGLIYKGFIIDSSDKDITLWNSFNKTLIQKNQIKNVITNEDTVTYGDYNVQSVKKQGKAENKLFVYPYIKNITISDSTVIEFLKKDYREFLNDPVKVAQIELGKKLEEVFNRYSDSLTILKNTVTFDTLASLINGKPHLSITLDNNKIHFPKYVDLQNVGLDLNYILIIHHIDLDIDFDITLRSIKTASLLEGNENLGSYFLRYPIINDQYELDVDSLVFLIWDYKSKSVICKETISNDSQKEHCNNSYLFSCDNREFWDFHFESLAHKILQNTPFKNKKIETYYPDIK